MNAKVERKIILAWKKMEAKSRNKRQKLSGRGKHLHENCVET